MIKLTEDFLIGTYTNKTSKGMYRVTLDTDQERLVNVRLAVKLLKPSYVQVGSNHWVYTIKKAANGQKGVAIYQLGATAADAKLLGEALFDGPSPAYLGLDEKRHLLFGANYHAGRIDVFKVSPTGQLTRSDVVEHHGETGPRPEQEMPHVHYADLTPDGRLTVCDLGEDRVSIYDISSDGKLTAVSDYQFPSGAGPRHMLFGKDGQFAYVMCELSSELTVLRYELPRGRLPMFKRLKPFRILGQPIMVRPRSGCPATAGLFTQLTVAKIHLRYGKFKPMGLLSTFNQLLVRVISRGTLTLARVSTT